MKRRKCKICKINLRTLDSNFDLFIECLPQGLKDTLEDYLFMYGVERRDLIKKSGIHPNTLVNLTKMHYVPRLDTLLRLAYVLEENPVMFFEKFISNANKNTLDKKINNNK